MPCEVSAFENKIDDGSVKSLTECLNAHLPPLPRNICGPQKRVPRQTLAVQI